MAAYSFITRWRIAAPLEAVWPLLDDLEHYGQWWPAFVGYADLTPGLHGVGGRSEQVVRGPLPYKLRYVTTVTEYAPPRIVAYDSIGDLEGKGRFVLEPDGNNATNVTFHWDVSTKGAVLNFLAPLLKPLFAWNHNWVMREGQRGLAARLADSAAGHSSAPGFARGELDASDTFAIAKNPRAEPGAE